MKSRFFTTLVAFFILTLGGCSTQALKEGFGDITHGAKTALNLPKCVKVGSNPEAWDQVCVRGTHTCETAGVFETRDIHGQKLRRSATSEECTQFNKVEKPFDADSSVPPSSDDRIVCKVLQEGKLKLCHAGPDCRHENAERHVYWGIKQSDGSFEGFRKTPESVGPEYCSLVEK